MLLSHYTKTYIRDLFGIYTYMSVCVCVMSITKSHHYMILQTEEFEKKKLLCKCLRYVAHSKLANLLFMSSKSESLIAKARASISAMVFGTSCRYVLFFNFRYLLLNIICHM